MFISSLDTKKSSELTFQLDFNWGTKFSFSEIKFLTLTCSNRSTKIFTHVKIAFCFFFDADTQNQIWKFENLRNSLKSEANASLKLIIEAVHLVYFVFQLLLVFLRRPQRQKILENVLDVN